MTQNQESQIGDYIIKRTLGKGTFSKVKLGIHKTTKEKVAIKILEKSKIKEKDDLERIIREMEILNKLNHPNIAKVYEICESDEYFFIIMEYCSGGELFNYIVRNHRLTEEESSYFFYQIINCLEYIHSKKIAHRDLKPENLLLDENNIIKIIDFGLSNFYYGKKLTTPCGSPCYASPEMISGNKYNGFLIDIWAIGITLFAMICGFLPFEDDDNEILFKKILECKLKFPFHVSKCAKDIIRKILVTDPNERIDIKDIKLHPFYLCGKDIFEEKFLVVGNDDRDDEDVIQDFFNKGNIRFKEFGLGFGFQEDNCENRSFVIDYDKIDVEKMIFDYRKKKMIKEEANNGNNFSVENGNKDNDEKKIKENEEKKNKEIEDIKIKEKEEIKNKHIEENKNEEIEEKKNKEKEEIKNKEKEKNIKENEEIKNKHIEEIKNEEIEEKKIKENEEIKNQEIEKSKNKENEKNKNKETETKKEENNDTITKHKINNENIIDNLNNNIINNTKPKRENLKTENSNKENIKTENIKNQNQKLRNKTGITNRKEYNFKNIRPTTKEKKRRNNKTPNNKQELKSPNMNLQINTNPIISPQITYRNSITPSITNRETTSRTTTNSNNNNLNNIIKNQKKDILFLNNLNTGLNSQINNNFNNENNNLNQVFNDYLNNGNLLMKKNNKFRNQKITIVNKKIKKPNQCKTVNTTINKENNSSLYNNNNINYNNLINFNNNIVKKKGKNTLRNDIDFGDINDLSGRNDYRVNNNIEYLQTETNTKTHRGKFNFFKFRITNDSPPKIPLINLNSSINNDNENQKNNNNNTNNNNKKKITINNNLLKNSPEKKLPSIMNNLDIKRNNKLDFLFSNRTHLKTEGNIEGSLINSNFISKIGESTKLRFNRPIKFHKMKKNDLYNVN